MGFYNDLRMLNKVITNDSGEVGVLFRELRTNDNDKKFITNKYNLPKVIWIYWDDERAPDFIKKCVERIEFICPDYKVNFLNSKTIKEYIELPFFNHDVPIANISDYIRLALLYEYGGVWMDSSIILQEDISWITNKLIKHEAFMFYSDECTIDESFPIPESWFILAPVKSRFIEAWFNEFKKCILSSDPIGFYQDEIEKNPLVKGLTRPEYLLCYISVILVLQKDNFNILLCSASTTGHYYSYKYNFKPFYIAIELLMKNRKYTRGIKIIKLSSGPRNKIINFIDKGLFMKNSILGQYF